MTHMQPNVWLDATSVCARVDIRSFYPRTCKSNEKKPGLQNPSKLETILGYAHFVNANLVLFDMHCHFYCPLAITIGHTPLSANSKL